MLGGDLRFAGDSPRACRSTGFNGVEVVHTRGDGTGVPFVTALRMPVFFVHFGRRGRQRGSAGVLGGDPRFAGDSPRACRSTGFPGVEVVHTRGDGTGVPFVTALRMPVFLFITAFGA